MKQITVSKILEICKGKLLTEAEDIIIEDFNKDTRIIQNGEMYVAIKGEKFDGNKYVEEALEKSAIGCLVDDDIPKKILEKYKKSPIIKVENTIEAIQLLATYKRSLYDIPVVAVTGSVGKTSTKDIIASVLSQKYNVLKTEGNFNNHIGLPLTLLKLKDHTAVVVEMGMNNLGEISKLTNIAKPTICTITNIGTSHIGNLGSRENILKAKLEILEGLSQDGFIVINNDNELLNDWAKKCTYNVKTYGINNVSEYKAYGIENKEDGNIFKIKLNNNEENITVNIGGNHFVYNSLCAIAIADNLKMDINDIKEGIEKFELTKRRMDIKKLNREITLINDSYNASYDSMKAVLEYVKNIKGNRKIAVLGDMLELGNFSKELHEKVGEEVVKNNINVLITVGENAVHIARKAKELGMDNIYTYFNNADAIEKLKELMEQNDVIVLKASNGMKFNEIAENLE